MNNPHISKGWIAAIIIAAVVIIDQTIKIWVKCSFALYEDLRITDWFILRFVENNGMAFGMEWGPKLFLTWFRIIAVGLLIYYITRLCKKATIPTGYLVCISLITAGALGNVINKSTRSHEEAIQAVSLVQRLKTVEQTTNYIVSARSLTTRKDNAHVDHFLVGTLYFSHICVFFKTQFRQSVSVRE